MATQNNLTIGVNVTDNGTTKKVVKDVDVLAKKLEGVQSTANKGIPVGGTPGSRQAANRASTPTPSEMQAYGAGRGAMGATGASARDFANQAQGLGGVVRLYATLAANIFAVGAAYRALSAAVDTANLVRGLDQLGAASGVALGSLSKRLSEVTDGAISTREAMESVAKASSSGMSSENILRMGKVAKQAAQALGVDMNDAVSRLTRGITKLEPELLDELGIFTKVGKATDDYAKSVGKSASALTDFERRMAFANAVLEEGERKFSAIDFETNPYTQLLATLRDVAQVGLELVNVVFEPLAKFLASSPAALGAVITALGAVLVKQALPALGELRAGLQASSAQALKTAEDFKESFGDEFQTRLEQSFKIPDLEDQLRQAQIQLDKFKFTGKKPKSLLALEAGDTKAISSVNELLERRRATIETGMRGSKKASESQIAQAKQEAQYIQAVIALQEKRNRLESAYEATEQVAGKKQGRLDPEVIALKRYTELRAAADRSAIVSNAAQNAQIIGIARSWTILNQEIEQKGITGIRKYTTQAVGGLTAVASRASQVIGAFGQIGMIIAAAGAAFMFVDGLLSKNAKEMKEFSSSADLATEATENLSRTLKNIDKKPFGEQFSTESLKAIATAVNEVSSSLTNLIDNALAADRAANGWDRFIDRWKTLWGGDLRTRTGEALAENVLGSISKLGDSDSAQKAKQAFAKILQIDPGASTETWKKAFEAIANNEPKLREIQKTSKELSTTLQEAAFNAEAFDTAIKTGTESYKKFSSAFRVKDDFAELSLAILDSGKAIEQAFKTPEDALARLVTLVDDYEALALFGPEDQANIVKYGDLLVETNKAYEKQVAGIKAAKDELKKLQEQRQGIVGVDQYGMEVETAESKRLDQAIQAAKSNLDKREAQLKITRTEIANLTSKFPDLASRQLIRGAEYLSTSIAASLAKGSTKLQEAVLGVLSSANVEGTAQARGRIESARLAQEGALLQLRFDLVRQQKELLYQEQIFAEKERRALAESDIREIRRAGGSTAEAQRRRDEADVTVKELEQKFAIFSQSGSAPLAALKKIQEQIKAGNSVVKADARELFEYIQNQTGISIALRANRDAQEANSFQTQLNSLKEREAVSKREYDIALAATQQELRSIDLLEKQNGYLTDAEIARKSTLQAQAAGLELGKQQLAINTEIQSLELAYGKNQLNISESAFNAAKNALLERLKVAGIDKTTLDTLERRLTLEKFITDQYLKQFAVKRNLLNLEREIRDIEQETAQELSAMQLAYDESSGMYTSRQLEERKAAQELQQAEFDTVKKLEAAETKRQDALNELKTKYTEAQREAMLDEMLLIESRYDAETSGARKVLELRKQITQQTLADKQSEWFTTGVTGAIIAAFTEGGEAAADKLKQVFKDKIAGSLRESLEISIKTSVKDWFKGFTGGGGGTGTLKNILGALSTGDFSQLGTSLFSAASSFANLFSPSSFIASQLSSLSDYLLTNPTIVGAFSSLGSDTLGMAIGSFADGMASAGSLSGMQSAWAEGGAKLAGNIAGNVMGAMSALTISDLLSGGYKTGADGIVKAATAIAGYIFGPIAGVFGGLFNRAFGRKLTQQGILGQFGGEAGFTGTGYTFEKGGWFRSDRERTQELDTQTQQYLSMTFKALQMSSLQAARILGASSLEVSQAILDYTQDIRLNLLGKSEEQVKEIFEQLFTQIGESLSERAVFALGRRDLLAQGLEATDENITQFIAQFKRLGETFSEFLTRLSGALGPANQALDLLNLTLFKTSISGGAAADALIEGFEGLDQFSQATSFFFENFYAEADQFVAKTNQLQRGLIGIAQTSDGALSISDITQLFDGVGSAREEFRNLVEGLDLTTQTGQATFTALLRVAPAFAEVTDAIAGTAQTIEDVTSQFRELQVQILTLQGDTQAALALERQLALEGLDERLRPAQAYVFALEDVKTAQEALTEATREQYTTQLEAAQTQQQALETTISTLGGFIDNLRKFRDGLLLSQNTILTPQQQYITAREQFNRLLAQSQGPATTPEEIALRDQALRDLEGASASFLDASRTYNASSAQYTTDFNLVQQSLTTTLGSLQSQKTTAEQTLDAAKETVSRLESVVSSLGTLNSSVLTVAEATQNLADAILGRDAAAAAYSSSTSTSGGTTVLGGTATRPASRVVDEANIISQFSQPWQDASSEDITKLYELILGRAPDAEGLAFWDEAGNSIAQIARYIGTSSEAAAANLIYAQAGFDASRVLAKFADPSKDATASDVQALYRYVFGREGDSAGVTYWDNTGMSTQALLAQWARDYSDLFIPTYARGGLAQGLAIVGEQGPELVDFNTPGRVYTADQTAGMFTGASGLRDVAREVIELRKEVTRLREQQHQETAAVVEATYDAQSRGSDKVAQAVVTGTERQLQTQKAKQAVKLN